MKKVWLLESEQARWFEFEEPHDMPNDVTVTMLTETDQPAQQEPVAYMVKAHGLLQRLSRRADVADELACQYLKDDPNAEVLPLYESPPQREPLLREIAALSANALDDYKMIQKLMADQQHLESALFQAQTAAIGLAHKVKMYEDALEEIACSNNSEWQQDKAKQVLAQMRGVEI